MNDGKISVRYARALYDFACENKCETEVYYALRRFTSITAQDILAFEAVLKNPIISDNDKITIITTALGSPNNDCLGTFVRFIVEKKRESKLHLIALKYQEQYRADKNILLTHITTASELSPETLEKIKSHIADRFHAEVETVVNVDPGIIGGYTIDIEHNRLDVSIAGQLEKLKAELNG